jgi:hypothetical protein
MTITAPLTQKISVRRNRASSVGGWAFIVTGIGHLAVATLAPAPEGAAAVKAQMRTVHVVIGVTRDLSQLMTGSSLAMAASFVACGAGVLVLARRDVLRRRDPLVAGMAALSAVLLAISLAFFPAPPIVTMLVAVAAFGTAWVAAD